MKKLTGCFIFLLVLLLGFSLDLDARGRRGGGGSRGGGGGRRSGSSRVHRSPSMSRSHATRRTPSHATRRAPSQSRQPRQRTAQRAQPRPNAPRAGGYERYQQSSPKQFSNRGNRGNRTREQFNRDHFQHRKNLDNRLDRRQAAWVGATWAGLAAWSPYWNYAEPVYYDYGTEGNVNIEDGTVYVDSQAVGTSEQYAVQAETIAQAGTQIDPKSAEWMPFGVFGLTQDTASPTEPNMYLQLALSKEGAIYGTYTNTLSGTTETVQGAADQTTQRAAWGLTDRQGPIMETGLYNLTLEQTTVMVHFPDGSTQQWFMVRMPEPNE